MPAYFMALDQGTTSSRCIIFNEAGEIVSRAQKEFTQFYPQPGWVEQDAMEIWSTQLEVARQALRQSSLGSEEIAAIGITNQRETTIVWDRETGVPLGRAIVWQCRRTAAACDRLIEQGWGGTIREKTGLTIDAYFSATKLQWVLDQYPGARQAARQGRLLFGTVDSWLIWKLTGGRRHVTDVTNAARTMLFNIHTLQWDAQLLQLFDIPPQMLPEVVPSSGVCAMSDPALFGRALPIAGVAGDQQAALFGQGCFARGDAKNTYGTGGFLLMNTGEEPVASQNGLLTTVAWSLGGQVCYALEGSIFVAGAAVQWLRDELGLVQSAADTEYLAGQVEDTAGVYLVPAFVGLGAPYWDPYARGVLIGLTRGTGRNHIIRATLESMAFQTADVISAMEQDARAKLPCLRVDGGASANNLLLQMQADLMGAPVERPRCIETTAFGAAALAGLAVGAYGSLQQISQALQVERRFLPQMQAQARARRLAGWRKAVSRAMGWARPEE